MDEITQSRQAICDFLNTKKTAEAEKSARAAINNEANTDSLKALAAIGTAGLGAAWQQHPAKKTYEQVAPLAQSVVRQHPWLSLGTASALGALVVLSPGLRRQALQALQGQLPPQLRDLF